MLVNLALRNELESLKEKMAKTSEEIKSKLDEREENMKNLKKQVENKTKCIEELQQENKVLKKKITAESKKTSLYEGKVEKMKLLYDEATMIQRETDIRCQHKITEMVALMEKHKENELSCLKSELSSLKEQLKAEIEEKENLIKEHSRNRSPESEKKHKTYVIKTPPTDRLQSGRSTNLPSEQSTRKKQKVLLQLDSHSDSSEHTDLLSIVSEEEMFKKLYKDYPQASQLHPTAPKKTPAPSNVKSPGSALKLKTMRRMRDAGWTTVSKMDRKRKMKEVVKFFA
ncbi:synaptonemal complex protein 1-like isoform X5 [Hirundo rustica]|uniref:synaptonemal complex protein 1-like isoform X5 n=1 Tax=Hirundo rustica TaxID=43150 RepID=UPI001A942324|nr:synaptonemal complex protein 1-like isoform X5 [Hirundo rustica]